MNAKAILILVSVFAISCVAETDDLFAKVAPFGGEGGEGSGLNGSGGDGATGSDGPEGGSGSAGAQEGGSGAGELGGGGSSSSACVPTPCEDDDMCGVVPDGCGGEAQCGTVCQVFGGIPNFCNDSQCPSWNPNCNDISSQQNTCIGCQDDDIELACAGVTCGTGKDRCNQDVPCPFPADPEFPGGCSNYQTCVEDASDPQDNECFGCEPYSLFPEFCSWGSAKPFEYQCDSGFGSAECEFFPGPGIWCCSENELGCHKEPANPIWNNQCQIQLPGSTVVTCPSSSTTFLNNCQYNPGGFFCCNGEP